MTMDERIEAAEKAYDSDVFDSPREHVLVILAAAFPELSGDKPGWIAPWEATEAMLSAKAPISLREAIDSGKVFQAGKWEAMRDAYLGKGDGG